MSELQDMVKTFEDAAPDKVLMDKLYESLIESMPLTKCLEIVNENRV